MTIPITKTGTTTASRTTPIVMKKQISGIAVGRLCQGEFRQLHKAKQLSPHIGGKIKNQK